MSPQLDARENLSLAKQIDQGSLAEEPIYRSMLYPLVLSLLPQGQTRIPTGLLLGLACHLLNGFLVYRLSSWVWKMRSSSTLAAVLYLLNPASLFFALQLLDVTFAITLFMGGIVIALVSRENKFRMLLSGLLLGLSILARPHFLTVVFLAPAILALLPGRRFQISAFAWIPVLVILLLQGLYNFQHAGEFRMLPWQGSYNLWAANRPGANGLYFKQVLDMSTRGNSSNPAKAESISLFAQDHPEEQPPFSIDEMNSYWKGRFLDRLRKNPWALLKLSLYKGYAVINSREQYNNLSFPYHRNRLPWLRYNPLCWGILLVMGILSLVLLFRENKLRAMLFILLIVSYASTLILFYASARFRLPLVPLLAVLSGGLFHCLSMTRGKPALQAGLLVLAGSTLFLTFSSFAGIRNDDTFIQDELLMANANADLGRDLEAARMARRILVQYPGRNEAQRIYSISYFNLRLLRNPSASQLGNWQDQKTLVNQVPPTDPVQDSILGVYYWNWGQHDQARILWEKISSANAQDSHLAEACLTVTGVPQPPFNGMSPLEQALNALLFEPSAPSQP